MKTFCQAVERIPDWALCYLINNTLEGLSEQEVNSIHDFFSFFEDIAKEFNCDIIVSPVEEQPEGYFTWHPAFGLACTVTDCYVTLLYTEQEEIQCLQHS